MKKGIALSSILYTILVLFLALLYGIMALILSSRSTLETLKKNLFKELNPSYIYDGGVETMLTKEMFEDENVTWEEIIPLIKEGLYDDTLSSDLIGAEKDIDMGTYGVHTFRVVNVTPCTDALVSKTACGFVLDETDIIKLSNLHGTNKNYEWHDLTIQDTFEDKFLPAISFNDEILEVTATETHEKSLTYTRFNTKLYVFSIEEITGEQQSNDSLAGTSRKLDYYEVNDGVSGIAIKKYNGVANIYPTRSPVNTTTYQYSAINSSGGIGTVKASGVNVGYTFAFRLN